MSQHPVFFDPDRRRWPRIKRGLFAVALTSSLLFLALVASVLVNPVLPALHLPSAAMLPHVVHLAPPQTAALLPNPPRTLKHAKQRLEAERRRSRQPSANSVPPPPPVIAPGKPIAAGFFVNWDDSSFTSLSENLSNLDLVMAEWLHLQDETGTLRPDDPRREAQVVDFIRSHRPSVRIMPLVNNFNGTEWEGGKLAAVLRSPAARSRIVQQSLEYVTAHHYQGLSLDFEASEGDTSRLLTPLVEELAAAFHARQLELAVNVPADDQVLDYTRLGRSADYVIVMAYDEHWAGGDAGPVASDAWFSASLRRRAQQIPANRLIVAIGNYGYDWVRGKVAEERTYQEAVTVARESDATIALDRGSLNPSYAYEDERGTKHQVWFLDAVSAFNEARTVRALGLGGVALWRLGSEDPSIWTFFGKDLPLDAGTAARLEPIRYGYDLDYEGVGEILQVTARPSPGLRRVTVDDRTGTIVGERIEVWPSPYVLTRYGGGGRRVVLTFDDGPDPVYTPAILDVLDAKRVPAVFFVIGVNAEAYPRLLRREVDDGHEIGNHTFSHPNVAYVSAAQLRLELSATERLFESELGLKSHLFRPPYAEDSEPETPEQVRPIEDVSGRGYVTVGMRIDPGDWQRPGVNAIVRRTVEQAESGAGNVILLHDAGGDRTETVAALPLIIDQLRARGFTFVSLSSILGRPRDEIMPRLSPGDRWRATTDALAFDLLNVGMVTLRWLFLTGIVLGVARLLFVGSLAIAEWWRARRPVDPGPDDLSVAVIVPAYNEERVVVQTVTSLLASTHPSHFEILVVDDGSTDRTGEVVRAAFFDEPRVRLITTANAGKAAAINTGVSRTQADVVVVLDADTVFARDTITKLVRHFHDPSIGAVAGNARVGNRINLLTRWQALEYVTSQNLDRRAFDVLNCITVVPGAVGAWRRELVERAGGFSTVTLAEDADLTMAILELGYRVIYESDAMALTEAPDTVRGFVKQRYRWMYGTFQAAWKHRHVLFRPRHRALGLVALPNIFVFQVLFPLVSPVMDLVMLIALVTGLASWWQHPAQFSGDTLRTVLFYYALFQAVDLAAALLAFALERNESARLLVLLVWQRFFYRQLMYYVAVRALVASLRGGEVGWGKLERKATVKV